MNTLFTCIVFFKPEKNIRPRKYRNCKLDTFTAYCQRSGAWYVNVYDQKKYMLNEYIYNKKRGHLAPLHLNHPIKTVGRPDFLPTAVVQLVDVRREHCR
jgi:hypothetical protein